MNFKDNDPIYLQIAEYVNEKILLGEWVAGEKIPSVRDLAIELQVNPNTIMRSYDHLQNMETISNKRGIGFFINDHAIATIRKEKKSKFLNEELPFLFKTMQLLNLSIEEIAVQYQKFNSKSLKDEKQ